MDELLMLRGDDRHCVDCGTVTIFLPISTSSTGTRWAEEEWVCTACDGAVVVPGLAA